MEKFDEYIKIAKKILNGYDKYIRQETGCKTLSEFIKYHFGVCGNTELKSYYNVCDWDVTIHYRVITENNHLPPIRSERTGLKNFIKISADVPNKEKENGLRRFACHFKTLLMEELVRAVGECLTDSYVEGLEIQDMYRASKKNGHKTH